MHEAKCHDDNCFVTLTYSDEHLPREGSLDRSAFRLFMDRVRKAVGYGKVRYFHCGEYGERFGRPHYHALLFGLDFPDKRRYPNGKEYPEWTSPMLDDLWGLGGCRIGSVSFESAAYLTRYMVKSEVARLNYGHWSQFQRAREEYYAGREPEYHTMSRRPGLGTAWLEQFGNEVYPADEVIARGRPGRPPRFYDKKLEEVDVLEAWQVKRARAEAVRVEEQSEERLDVRERVALAKFHLYSREVL